MNMEKNIDAFTSYHQRMALPRLVCNEIEKQRGGQVSSPMYFRPQLIKTIHPLNIFIQDIIQGFRQTS